ncbi:MULTISPECIES: sulfate ABC transporter substrate-binding protein [Massilia]|jgi:sulfate/thiosulfate transport system substrate-binding protein|uniref:sulfate ABC transporter substrate-binding protein n=1 Tax=Massilia TaxID=149698 RepID=UPI000D945590|nr:MULTISPECIES: sulfate ABC transporter substrate-binding protein [Massilia]QYG03254.1 sulfate ABC transporter substrate-binding protein [Massilia sp. NP310]HAK92402.1 sulfate ABC transporter substrate-binding protein [Massilia timonae]
MRNTTPNPLRRSLMALVLSAGAALPLYASAANAELLNVSYDVARELYKEVNPAFIASYKQQTGQTVTIKQSHGGSSKQARAVADGLAASVVTMNQANDIDMLADRGLVAKDWAKKFPNNAAPYYSTMVFLVRKGNPKQVRDWQDLARPGVGVVIPNPKTAGNGRYTYLAAWGSVIKKGGNEAQARDLVARIFKNVPILDGGGRAATTTFTQRQIGDVLVTFENEVSMVRQEFGNDFEVVYPSTSILAESPVAVVDKVVDRLKIRQPATAYLNFLYSPAGQEIGAKHFMRVRSEAVMKKYAANYKPISLFTVDEVFGGWSAAQKRHFNDGGEFDKIYQAK